MHILVITRSSWSNNNNIGNTMTNIFSPFKDDDIYGFNFRSEPSLNDITIKNFSISEQQIINFFRSGKKMGHFSESHTSSMNIQNEKKMYDKAKSISGSNVLLFIRELLWFTAPWKNSNLDEYLDEVKPDIVFMPVFGCWYPHRVLNYIIKYTGAKLVLFHADENYTLNHFSLSPFFWIYRLILRKWVKNSVKISDLNYAISKMQSNEYTKIFKKDVKLLFKGLDFIKIPEKKTNNTPLKLLFTGNISSNRYKSLSLIGKTLKRINEHGKKAELDIHTLTPLTKAMKKALDIPDTVYLKPPIPAQEVQHVQKNADILIHVESFDLKARKQVRLSFSTKLVDYFHQAKCIFAVGPKEVASMDYLINNDAAITATNEKEIEEKLRMIIENPDIIKEYGDKAWECGKKNHQIDKIQKMLKEDFEKLIEK